MPIAALLATLALAGCSSGHVGESWQCPLAAGGSCGSVAAADPAVPDASGETVLDAPLWKPHDGASGAFEETACTGDCGKGSGPFGWLGRLFEGGEDRDAGSAQEVDLPEAAISASARREGSAPAAIAVSSAMPVEPGEALHSAGVNGPDGDGLRMDEVVARIWIAPFVDADGVYREAGHVRVVLEPAAWRTE